MSQRQVAAAMGFGSTSTISNWERGRVDPTDDDIRVLANIYGCGWEPAKLKPKDRPMLTSEEQTHYDNAKKLADVVRSVPNNGRHDGLGNPVISVELYMEWAHKACDGIDWLLTQVIPEGS